MAAVLSWNEKKLEVTSNKQYTYGNWNAGVTYETETEDAGGGKQKKKKGGSGSPGIGTISFDVTLRTDLGIDVKSEYDWWRKQCLEGAESLLYLGQNQFGACKWRLSGVTQSDLVTLADGTWKKCTMQISFEESAAKVKQTKLEKQAAKLSKKLEKAIKKAENAKTDKAREKAAQKAAKLQKQLEEVQVKVAEEKAAAAKAKREAKQKAAEAIKRYYDQQ